MKILAISDLFVPGDVMRQALAPLRPERLDVVQWQNRDRSELHQRVRRIERDGPDVVPPPDEMWGLAEQADLIVTHLCPLGTEVIRRATNLRMIGVCCGGIGTIACQAAEARGIPIYNVPGRNAVAVAEFTIGLMLAERRNIARAHHAIATGQWRKEFLNVDHDTQLSGKIVGLVGFGEIGKLVAQRLAPFGAELLVYDPFQSQQSIAEFGGQSVGLDELLVRSDVVSLHVRRDEHEAPLIGERELALMKPTSQLINTARAYLVDQDALIVALQNQRLGGAALDVFSEEPLDDDSPLRTLDNITLTPHLAGSTREAFHRAPFLLVERIRREIGTAG